MPCLLMCRQTVATAWSYSRYAAKGMFVLERMREKIYVCSKNKCIVLTSAEKLHPIWKKQFHIIAHFMTGYYSVHQGPATHMVYNFLLCKELVAE